MPDHLLLRPLASNSLRHIVVAVAGAMACTSALAASHVYSDAGATASDLLAPGDPLVAFRTDLGSNNGAAPAPGATTGRREINWDAQALDSVADPAFMPASQFNGLAAPFARGAQFSTPGTGFFVSRRCEQDGDAAGCGGSNILLGFGPGTGQNVNFNAFSAQRIFSPVGSNVMDVTFAVPGSPAIAATTSAFGAIFLDVEFGAMTHMELFGIGGNSLGSFNVEASSDGGMSFLGVRYDAGERIARVRLTLGDMVITGHGTYDAQRKDLVGLDDFIYAEPQPIPEPASAVLAGLGLLVVLRRWRATGG